MANDLVARVARENGFTDTALELIRNVAAKDCTDEEVAQLLILAGRTGLDPLAKQIYMIKRRVKVGKNQWREVATPQTSIDGYRLIADRTERYAPGREPTFGYSEEGVLVSATAYIKKLVGGTWHEVSATAFWDEYVQTYTKDGQEHIAPMWQKMPHLMLSKCAEALALRRAFPAELSGIYTAEEMMQADNDADNVIEGVARQIAPAPALVCEECRGEITGTDKGTAADVAGYTTKYYGRQLCAGCARKQQPTANGNGGE